MSTQYTNAILELRQFISDTDQNKKVTKKKLIGSIDGVNTMFFAYDKRIIQASLVVYVANVVAPATLNSSVDAQITITTPPPINTSVVASYYWQFFTDTELTTYLNKGAEQTSQGTGGASDYLNIQPGLYTAALYFAAGIATKALTHMMLNRRHSEEFLVEEDGNDDTKFSQTISAMVKVSDSYMKDGITFRDDFYKRQGQRNAPAFAIKTINTRRYGPNR